MQVKEVYPRKVDKKKYDTNYKEIFRKNTMKEACDVVAKLRKKK